MPGVAHGTYNKTNFEKKIILEKKLQLFLTYVTPRIPMESLKNVHFYMSKKLYFITIHVESTVLSIFQKAVTFDHILTPYTYLNSLFLNNFFVGMYISNEKA